jgi:AcrR family transcriptional regulator
MARPRAEDRIDIPGEAVAAMIALAAERGLAHVTLADVAARVGCRAPALYRYFRNKDALVRAVHDEGFARLYAYKIEADEASRGDPLARLRLGGVAYVRFALENPALYAVMFGPGAEAPAEGAEGSPFDRDPALKALRFLKESVARVQALGYLPGRDPGDVAFLLWSCVHGVAALTLQNRTPIEAEARHRDPRAQAEAVVDGIMALIAGTRAPA